MARVFLKSGLRRFSDGIEEVEVDGATVRDVITALDSRFPGIGEYLASGTAVAIDGDIIGHALHEPVPEDAEIYFLPAVSGG